MNKEDLKKEYENINISKQQKEKIYNNIIRNRKRKSFLLPVLGFGTVALASVLAFVIFNRESNSEVLQSFNSLTLEANYQKEIIVNAKSYLEANNIDLSSLKDGQSTEIDTGSIVKKDEYNTCQGKLIITKYADDYSYDTKVTCGTTSGRDIKFKLYEGDLRGVYNVDDGLIVVSSVDSVSMAKYEDSDYYYDSNNLNIVMYDLEGNVKWSTKYEGIGTDNSPVSKGVVGFHQDVTKYIMLIENHSEQRYEADHSGSSKVYYTYILIEKDGTIVDNKIIDDYGKIVGITEFIGEYDNDFYYSISLAGEKAILKINEYKYYIMGKYDILEETDDIGATRKSILVHDYYMYGYNFMKSFDDRYVSYSNTIYKTDLSGDIIWEVEIEPEKNGHIHDMVVLNDTLFVKSYYSKGDDKRDYIIRKYSLDGEYLGTFPYKEFIDTENIMFDLSTTNDSLKFEYVEGDNYHAIYTDYLGKVINRYDIDMIDVKSNFTNTYLYNTNIVNDTVIQVFSATENKLNDTIVIAFYK